MTTTPQDELQEDVLKKIEELVYCGRVAAEGNQHYSFVQEDLSILARFMLEREKKAVEEARREQMEKDAEICINIKKTVATKSVVDFVGIAAEGTASICAKEIRHQIIL